LVRALGQAVRGQVVHLPTAHKKPLASSTSHPASVYPAVISTWCMHPRVDLHVLVVDLTRGDTIQLSFIIGELLWLFVFAVRSAVPELKAMLNEVWASPNVPLLVLAAMRDGSARRKRSAVEIAEDLSLAQLHRPWQVCRWINYSLLISFEKTSKVQAPTVLQ
jgi:hypothetical protein